MSKNLPLKSTLVGAFFVGLVLGSALPVGVANAASYRGGLLVTRPTPTPRSFSEVGQLQIKNFLAGIDQVFATAGRFIIGFFDGLMPQAKPVALRDAQGKPAAQATRQPVVLGVEDDIAELGSRVAVLEGKDTGGDTSVSLGTLAIQGDNLARNSSFEVSDSNDTPRYWSYQLDSSYGNTFKSAEGIRSGKYGLKFLGGSHGGLGVSQPDTKLEAGRSYVLSLYVKAVNVGAATLNFGFWDEVANARGTMKSVSYAGTKDWHRVSLVVEHAALSDKGKKWFPLIEVNNLGIGNIYIDDVQLSEGTVVSSYNSDLGDDAGQILGGGAVLVDNNGNVFPAKDGIGELGLSGSKFKALTLSKASIDKDGNTTIDGATTLKGGVTLGDESSDTITFNGTVAGFTLTGSGTYNDDVKLSFGTGGPADVLWETADANANELIVAFDEGGSVDVPVLVVGDASIDNVNLGFFDGVTDPSIAVVSDDAGDYGRIFVTDAGVFTLRSGTGDIILQADNDTGDYFTFSSDGTDLTLATTDSAALAINPAGAISIDSGGTFTISDAVDLNNTLDLDTTGAVSMNTSQGAANAIELIASAGGIDISTGSGTQNIDILSGASINLTAAESAVDAIVLTASAGGIDILASGAAAGEDIDVTATGSSVNLTSTESVADSITLISGSGGIDLSTGGDTQDIDILSGDALNLTSAKNNAAAVVVTASAGGIDILASAASAGEDIDVIATGSSVNLQSTEGVANAITLVSTSGGIDLSTGGDAAANDIDLLSGSSINLTAAESAADSIVLTSSAGGIDILASAAAAGEDIDIIATGSSVNLSSTEGVADAITIVASAGGIDISSGSGSRDIDILAGSTNNTAINMKATAGGISMSGGTDAVNSSGVVITGGNINLYGDVAIDMTATATTNGVCHSGAGSDTVAYNRTLVACSGAPADLAEWYETKLGVEAGDVVVMSGETIEFSYTPFDPFTGMQLVGATKTERVSVLKAAEKSYSPYVVGVVSTSPYQVIGAAIKDVAKNPQPIALSGRVPVKVTGENGPIEVGDYLTTSSTPGYAMKANKGGMVVGTALEAFSGTTGMITVFVGRGYVAGAVYDQMALLAALGASSEPGVGGGVLGATTVATEEPGSEELPVTTAAVFAGTLVVKGAATFEGVLTVNGVAVVAELDVAGAITQTFTAGEAVNPGDAVAIVGDNTVGKGSPVIGVAATSATAGGSVKVAIAGTVGGFSGLTPGQVVYAGEQAIGVARSATSVLVMPNLPNKTAQPTPEATAGEAEPQPTADQPVAETPPPVVELPSEAPVGTESGTPL